MLPHAQGVLIGVPLLSLGVSVTEWQEAGSRTGWARLVHLCPLIRCFRQGGGRCGYSLPAHSCGVWQGQGQTSPALSSLPQGVCGFPFCCPTCLHLHDIEGRGPEQPPI